MAGVDRRTFLLGAAALAAPMVAPGLGHAPRREFAYGGVVTVPPRLVGDTGPEMVLPHSMAGIVAAIVVSVAVNEAVRELTVTVRLP